MKIFMEQSDNQFFQDDVEDIKKSKKKDTKKDTKKDETKNKFII